MGKREIPHQFHRVSLAIPRKAFSLSRFPLYIESILESVLAVDEESGHTRFSKADARLAHSSASTGSPDRNNKYPSLP